MKKALLTLVVLAAAGGGGYWYYTQREIAPKFTVQTVAASRGDVVETVGATGTVQAVTTVQVGTQVSGTIQVMNADFNSLVKKGQILARLDPSLFETQIEQARANLARAQADLERLRVSLDDARTKAARARELSGRQLLPRSELDTAEVNVRLAEAQIRSSEAQVVQAQASLNQNEVNLAHTIIEAPIDGLVISRNVDVGQTVAASMQAPTLFVLAADLTKMQVLANLDESDVGRIRPGQHVTFRVDAYPSDTFTGSVSQVRLEPKVQQNVVTYATVIDVPNNELKLKPGMTANVNVEIARASNVLRVPNSALRFRPTADMYTAIGQTPPDPATLRAEFGGGRRGGASAAAAGAPASATATATGTTTGAPGARPAGSTTPRATASASAPAAGSTAAPPTAEEANGLASPRRRERTEGRPDRAPTANPDAPAGSSTAPEGGRGAAPGSGGGRGFGGRGGDLAARMQNMTPEEREQTIARMRARGFDPTALAAAPGTGAPQRGRGAAPTPARAPRTGGAGTGGGATTIDALFGPLPRVEAPGRVWLYVDKQLTAVRLRTGISDGQVTEVIDGDLAQGAELVTNISTGTTATRPAATNPFGQPGRGTGGFPGGGFPGGGFPGGGGFGGGGGGTRPGGGGR